MKKYPLYLLLSLTLLASPSLADILYLKNNKILRGKIQKKGKWIYIQTKYGTLKFHQSQVLSIQYSTPQKHSTSPQKNMQPPPIPPHLKTYKLFNLGLYLQPPPQKWRWNPNPPEPLCLLTLQQNQNTLHIHFLKNTTTHLSNTPPTRLLQQQKTKLYQHYERILYLQGESIHFLHKPALYYHAKVQPYLQPFTFLQALQFRLNPSFLITISYLSPKKQTRKQFLQLLSHLQPLPTKYWKNGLYLHFQHAFQIQLPPKWKQIPNSQTLLSAISPHKAEIHILQLPSPSPNHPPLKIAQAEIQKFSYKNFVKGKLKQLQPQHLLLKGKFWTKKLMELQAHFLFSPYNSILIKFVYPYKIKNKIKKTLKTTLSTFTFLPKYNPEKQYNLEQQALHHYLQGRTLYLQKKYLQALLHLNKAIQIFPNYFRARYLKILILLHAGKIKKAKQEIQLCPQYLHNPTHIRKLHAQLLLSEGKKFLQLAQYPKAISKLEKALRYNQNRNILQTLENAYIQQIELYRQKKKYKQAFQLAYKNTKKLNPYQPKHLPNLLAYTLQEYLDYLIPKKQYSKANKAAEKSIQLLPHHYHIKRITTNFYYHYAQYLLQTKRQYLAKKYAKKILKIIPHDPRAKHILQQTQK